MTYELRYGKTGVVHITGLPEATKASTDGMTYAQSACPALSRVNFYTKTVRLASFEDPRPALQRTKEFGSSHSLCKRCEAAAQRVIEDIRKKECPICHKAQCDSIQEDIEHRTEAKNLGLPAKQI